MQVLRLNDALLKPAYAILCQSLVALPTRPPFGMTYCLIEPRGKTSPHDHYDGEMFLILSGRGRMRIRDEDRDVSTGDVVVIPNHSEHDLTNLSEGETLRFLSIYWDEPASRRDLAADYLIYSAPPTPNGKLHVGHLSGPYIAADVARQYLRLRAASATYVSGADENQTYVPTKARSLGRAHEPVRVAQEYTREILGILESFGARPDSFLTPHSDGEYRAYVSEFFSTLVENGALLERTAEYPFCPECAIFVHESDVSGGCPHCGQPTNGNGCEACGLYNDCRDLKEPRCNRCRSACIPKSSKRMAFPLSKYESSLRGALAEKTFNPRMRRYVQRLIDQGLAEVTVTYPGEWGIPAPRFPGQVIYEWFEMAAAYLYQARQARGDYAHFWVEKSNRVLLAFGFDNSFFYMTFVPALLRAYDARIKYPDAFLTNFFFLLEGKKFSTSRNHAVWGDEILEKVGADALRLYLAKTRAERSEANFTLSEFAEFVRSFGVETVDALFGRINALVARPRVPNESAVSAKSRIFLDEWNAAIRQGELCLNPERMSLNAYAECVFRAIDALNDFVAEGEALGEIDRRTLSAGLKAVAQLLSPICPGFGGKIFAALGLRAGWSAALDLPTAPIRFELPVDYFSKELAGLSR